MLWNQPNGLLASNGKEMLNIIWNVFARKLQDWSRIVSNTALQPQK